MNAEIHIRPAALADVPAMLLLEQAAPQAAHWPAKTYEKMFNAAAPRIMLLAESAEALCGFCVARIGADEGELENIVVTESHRRRGLGRRLLSELMAAARAKNVAHLLLEVRESNQAARALYESCGFTISSRRKDYYSAPAEDALSYALPLQLP